MKQLKNLGYAAAMAATVAFTSGCKSYNTNEDKPQETAPVVEPVGVLLAGYQSALNTVADDGYVSAPGAESDVNEMETVFDLQKRLAGLEARVTEEGDEVNMKAHAGLTARTDSIVEALYGSKVLDGRGHIVATTRKTTLGNNVSYVGVKQGSPALVKGTAKEYTTALGVQIEKLFEVAMYNTDPQKMGWTKQSWAAAIATAKKEKDESKRPKTQIMDTHTPVPSGNFHKLSELIPETGWALKPDLITKSSIAKLDNGNVHDGEFVHVLLGATVAPDAKMKLTDETKAMLSYEVSVPQPVVPAQPEQPATDKPEGDNAKPTSDKPEEGNPLTRESDNKPKNTGLPNVPAPAENR